MSAERYGAYSVLMSVYSKENPAWLKLAIESIQDQTLPTSDFVLVCDGPLTPELDGVIYVRSTCEVVHDRSYYVYWTHGLMPEGYYNFDSAGRMILDSETE